MWPFRRNTSVPSDQEVQRALSVLSPDEVRVLGGLPGEAIAGFFVGPTSSLEFFHPNRTYIDFLQRVIAEFGGRSPDLVAGAQAQKEGWLYIIDPRTPEGPNGHVGPEDIFGAFEVRGGVLVPGSYTPNDNYRVLTENGLTQLTPALRTAFIAALPRVTDSPSHDGHG